MLSPEWRHRDAAARAYIEYLEAGLLPKYQGKTLKLFKASLDMAQ